MSAKLMDDARNRLELSKAERIVVKNEVQFVVACRQLLVDDVHQLEQFLIDQRERLRAVVRQIETLRDENAGSASTMLLRQWTANYVRTGYVKDVRRAHQTTRTPCLAALLWTYHGCG